MKKVSLFVFITITRLFLIFPCFSIAQKKPKKPTSISKKPTPAKKPTEVVANESKPEWQTLRVEECGFTAEIPGKFKKATVNVDGRLSTSWTFSTSNNGATGNIVTYDISCSPIGDVEIQNPNDFLLGQLMALDGRVLGKADISLSGNPGVESVQIALTGWIEQKRTYVLVSRGISIRIFMAVINDEVGRTTDENRKRFFNSLKLL